MYSQNQTYNGYAAVATTRNRIMIKTNEQPQAKPIAKPFSVAQAIDDALYYVAYSIQVMCFILCVVFLTKAFLYTLDSDYISTLIWNLGAGVPLLLVKVVVWITNEGGALSPSAPK